MATYHCAIKLGTSGKTIPHLDYIKREGRYQKDTSDQDLLLTKSGHMPVFAQDDERVFWNACAAKDIRSYREIEFALPNELTLEEQKQLVEDFIEEVIPNNPYTYAIHETESAVHGVKNPHCHLMFSERMMNELVAGMDKKDFFKKHGRTIHGDEYGGSVKDRSWAGRGTTAKYYEVRKALADCMNRAYEKRGLAVRVDHRSIQDQSADLLNQGNIEAVSLDRSAQRRVHERLFRNHTETIKEAIQDDEASIEMLPFRVQERIIHERLRALDRRIEELTEEYNKALEPTSQERDYALHRMAENTETFIQVYRNPFSYLKKKLHQVQGVAENVPEGTMPLNPFTQEIAYQDEAIQQEQYLVADINPVMLIADLELTKADIEAQLASIPLTPQEALKAVMTKEDKEQLALFNKDLALAHNRIFMAKETGVELSGYEEPIREAGAALKELYNTYHTPQLVAQAKVLQASDNKRRPFYGPRKPEAYEDMAVKEALGYNPFKDIKEQIRSRQSLLTFLRKQKKQTKKVKLELQELQTTYELMRPKYITEDIKKAALAIQEQHEKMFKRLAEKPLRAYEEKLMNEASGGSYFKQKNKLNFHARKLRDALRSEPVTKTSTDAIAYITSYRDDFLSDCATKYKDKALGYLKSQEQRKERLETALHKAERLLATVNDSVLRKHVEEQKKTITRVSRKHAERKAIVKQKTAETVSRKAAAIKKYKEMSRPLSWHEDRLLNEATSGALFRYKEQLRSKESIRKYQLKTGVDTTAIDKEIADVKKSITALRNQFMTTAIQDAARRDHEAMLKKRPALDPRRERNRLQAISRKRNASQGTKAAAQALAASVSGLFANEEDNLVTANIRVGGDSIEREFKKFHY